MTDEIRYSQGPIFASEDLRSYGAVLEWRIGKMGYRAGRDVVYGVMYHYSNANGFLLFCHHKQVTNK